VSESPPPPKPFGGLFVWFMLAIVVGLVIGGVMCVSKGMFPGMKN
jgi:hypothetical protein